MPYVINISQGDAIFWATARQHERARRQKNECCTPAAAYGYDYGGYYCDGQNEEHNCLARIVWPPFFSEALVLAWNRLRLHHALHCVSIVVQLVLKVIRPNRTIVINSAIWLALTNSAVAYQA